MNIYIMWHPEAVIETVSNLGHAHFGLQTDDTIRRFIQKMKDIEVL